MLHNATTVIIMNERKAGTGKSGERIRQITIPDTFGHVGNHAYLKGIIPTTTLREIV